MAPFPFALRLQANAPDEALQIPEIRDSFLGAVDAATEAVASSACAAIRRIVGERRVLERAFAVRDAQVSVVLLRRAREGFISQVFGSEPRLAGSSRFLNDVLAAVTISEGELRRTSLGLPIAFVTLDSIEFQEGSLFSKENLRLEVVAGVIGAIMATAAAPVVSDELSMMWKNHVAIEEVRKDIKENGNATFKSLEFPANSVEKDGAEALNFDEAGITFAERMRRIALVQSLLGTRFHTNLKVDGKLGPDTMHHLQQFAQENGIKANIGDKILREKLAAIAHPYR